MNSCPVSLITLWDRTVRMMVDLGKPSQSFAKLNSDSKFDVNRFCERLGL